MDSLSVFLFLSLCQVFQVFKFKVFIIVTVNMHNFAKAGKLHEIIYM